MKLAELMKELAEELGLPEVDLEVDGGATIAIDDELEIDLELSEDELAVIVSATVGQIPGGNREVVYGELLEANLLGQGTGGSALSIDPTLGEIVLCRSLPLDGLPFEIFDHELVTFVEALRMWRERLVSGAVGSGGDDREDSLGGEASQRPGGEGLIPV